MSSSSSSSSSASSSSSSSSSSVSSSSIEEEDENNENLTGMQLGFQRLEERIIVTTTTCTNTNTQLPVLPSIIDVIGCDITIDDIQTGKRELVNEGVDLKIKVNTRQDLTIGAVTPTIHFCWTGNLLIVRLLFLIGADCTKLYENEWFPMLIAASRGHLDICKWLFEYGGDAKYQINKEMNGGMTPLGQSYIMYHGREEEDKKKGKGKMCRWLLLNGGGQHLSSKALSHFGIDGDEETNSNFLVLWMRENIQLHNTFILFLCGATTMIATISSSSEPNDGGGDTCRHKRKRQIHPERSLQILAGHPGIMELIGNYVGVVRGKELRMLKEFNELVIEYNRDE